MSNKTSSNPTFSPIAVALLAIVLITAGGLFIKNALSSHSASNTAAPSQANDVNAVIENVKRHLMVKDGETPTVATIQDASLLKQNNPVFYQYAENGDRLLIWSDKAVLYSPSKDLILAVLPVTVTQTAATPPTPAVAATTTAPVQENAVIEVRNGSKISGLGKTLADNLKATGLNVLPAKPAKSTTVYPTTVIYVATGKSFPDTVQKIQTSLGGGTVVTNLDAELPLKSDILVVIGLDSKK